MQTIVSYLDDGGWQHHEQVLATFTSHDILWAATPRCVRGQPVVVDTGERFTIPDVLTHLVGRFDSESHFD